jgi:hypothetical protein
MSSPARDGKPTVNHPVIILEKSRASDTCFSVARQIPLRTRWAHIQLNSWGSNSEEGSAGRQHGCSACGSRDGREWHTCFTKPPVFVFAHDGGSRSCKSDTENT